MELGLLEVPVEQLLIGAGVVGVGIINVPNSIMPEIGLGPIPSADTEGGRPPRTSAMIGRMGAPGAHPNRPHGTGARGK